ncbi:MAG TPA: hypothetical protein VLK25_08300 [Allosphingosinicella sp.]|nr:hypothetical protein [Allosphingosinicella sp.]
MDHVRISPRATLSDFQAPPAPMRAAARQSRVQASTLSTLPPARTLLSSRRAMILRRFALLSLVLLAAPLAAKPGAFNPEQTRYRSAAIARCTSQLGEASRANPDQIEQLCSCAVDGFVSSRAPSALPALGAAGLPTGLGSEILRCLPDIRPDAAGELAALAMRPALPPPADASPAPSPAGTAAATPDKPAAAEDAAPSGPGLLDRLGNAFDGFSFASLPRWAWGLIALLGFLILRRLFRRPERDDDLMGPPHPAHYRNLPRY